MAELTAVHVIHRRIDGRLEIIQPGQRFHAEDSETLVAMGAARPVEGAKSVPEQDPAKTQVETPRVRGRQGKKVAESVIEAPAVEDAAGDEA